MADTHSRSQNSFWYAPQSVELDCESRQERYGEDAFSPYEIEMKSKIYISTHYSIIYSQPLSSLPCSYFQVTPTGFQPSTPERRPFIGSIGLASKVDLLNTFSASPLLPFFSIFN
jgi:hypothetical protein